MDKKKPVKESKKANGITVKESKLEKALRLSNDELLARAIQDLLAREGIIH